jgi:SAM-dependent methyltransferase
MQWLLLGAVIIVGMFGMVLLWGAPYLPTLQQQTDEALDLLDLHAGDHLLELGCGDGRVMLAALRRGWIVTGYELNPLLCAIAWLRTRRYGRRARVVCGNFWHREWPPANGIFVFLLDRYMAKLDKKIIQYKSRPVKVASYAFKIPGKHPARSTSAVYLYEYR